MKRCETHGSRAAVGYCHGCGRFGCPECLPASGPQGDRFCQACAERMGLGAPPPEPPRTAEQVHHRYVVRFKDGRRLRGTFYSMDLDGDGFNFVAVSPRADRHETLYIRFQDLKAIYQVREFAGNRRHPPRYHAPAEDDPDEAAVYFADGEVVRGHITGNRSPQGGRFYLIPRDPDDNNVMIVVESSAVDRVEVHGQRRARELHDLADNAVRKRILVYYWRHRGRSVTLAEMAQRIERVKSAVEQNLGPYLERGLIERRTVEGTDLLFLKDPPDRETRTFFKARFDEVSRFYFHGEARAPRGPRAV